MIAKKQKESDNQMDIDTHFDSRQLTKDERCEVARQLLEERRRKGENPTRNPGFWQRVKLHMKRWFR